MKKTIFLLLFIATLGFKTAAQLSAVEYTSKAYLQFKGSKTYVVKTGDAKFDEELANAMEETWKVTPYEVISNSEMKKKLSDKSASFMASVMIGGAYHYLALFNGGKDKIEDYIYDDMLAYCPINHFQNEPQNTDCYYRVGNMVESMVHSIQIVQKNDIKGNSFKIVKGLREYYNGRSAKIKSRTLLFCEETLGDKISEKDIAGLYPFKYEVCSKEKIEQVIKEKSTEYYYFQPGITLNKSMFVFDPSNGEVLYFEFAMMGTSITTSDIKDLAKVIKSGK